MTYKLTVKETNSKAGKYHYQVIDENGTLISERKSNREYAACTIFGENYFGRVDLAQKFIVKRLGNGYPAPKIAYLETK